MGSHLMPRSPRHPFSHLRETGQWPGIAPPQYAFAMGFIESLNIKPAEDERGLHDHSVWVPVKPIYQRYRDQWWNAAVNTPTNRRYEPMPAKFNDGKSRPPAPSRSLLPAGLLEPTTFGRLLRALLPDAGKCTRRLAVDGSLARGLTGVELDGLTERTPGGLFEPHNGMSRRKVKPESKSVSEPPIQE